MIMVVSAVTFALLSSAGGDALTALSDNPQISSETIERLRSVYGVDRPMHERYVKWLSGLVRGDMGESFFYRTPVSALVLSRFGNTALLGLAGLFIALFISATLAFISVRFPSRIVDRVIQVIVVMAASTPRIVLSLFVLMLTVWAAGSMFGLADGSFRLFILSAGVMAVPLTAVFLAQMHAELRRAMDEPFVQFARAKGLSENAVILRHASRAALNPVLSIFGLSLGSVIGGSVIVETILGWPGIGALIVSAVRSRDVALVMGVVIIASAAVWFGNSLAELLQMLNDKRMRSGETGKW